MTPARAVERARGRPAALPLLLHGERCWRPDRLEGKRCLVTGGSRGLGLRDRARRSRAQARRSRSPTRRNDDDARGGRGERCPRRRAPSRWCSRARSPTSAHVQGDRRQRVVAAWGGVDVLVNNAGITQILPIALLEEADWDEVMDVNVKGAYLFSRAVAAPMIRAKARAHPQHRLLRLRARRSRRRCTTPPSKSALRGLTEALAREVGRYGIQVNLLAPGLLDAGLARMLPAAPRRSEYLAQCRARPARHGRRDRRRSRRSWSPTTNSLHDRRASSSLTVGCDWPTRSLRDILRKGFDEFREFVNPLIAQRAELRGRADADRRAPRDGQLVDADGRAVEDFHGTQAFGHRHPAIAAGGHRLPRVATRRPGIPSPGQPVRRPARAAPALRARPATTTCSSAHRAATPSRPRSSSRARTRRPA